MQYFVVFLTVVFGTALANPMAVTSDDLKQQNREISSQEYLKRVFQGSTVSSVGRTRDIVRKLIDLGLYQAASIANGFDLNKIIGDSDVSSVTLCMPNDEAFEKWWQQPPQNLDGESWKNLIKAWIVPESIKSTEIRNNQKVQSLNGAMLRFNIYPDEVVAVNGARILEEDDTFANDIIQIIDKVIYPLPVGNVIETLDDNKALSIIVDLVRQADFVEQLESDPITVLVPTNDAFNALPSGVLDDLKRDNDKLRNVLGYHVVSDVRYSASLSSGQRVSTSQGNDISITRDAADQIFLNKQTDQSRAAKVVLRDIPTTNGVIQVIDQVLLPPQRHFVLV
ncbi:transforming growth factor-beta-induced protein ig-h3-like [Lytechinus variegatus]|uniref:transforming growth factor-beta-induced protein ig-h3-like n=1 Tax=Lytechinus variegatus TaxID=7654 RepID=UPI001BB11B8B|nr:transforming growth factor-beta-induced protein ig-h3-like [Lytechinus variegatus]